jgi:putative transposase
MWGKDKLGPILRDQGFAVSNATVGRIIESLIARGRVPRVADLIIRKPRQVAFEKPGDVIQIDTVSVTNSLSQKNLLRFAGPMHSFR